MEFKIVSDSSSDLLTLDGVAFESVPLKIITDENEYVDDSSLDVFGMLTDLKKYKGKSRTSCPNSSEYLDAFKEAKKVFCVTITSGLSGSYNAASVAAKEYADEDSGREVAVIDSLSTGPENALVIEKIRELILSGEVFDEIKRKIAEYQKRTRLIFSLESMHNLSRNGRVNPAVAKIAGLLGVRVVGRASDVGTLEITDKPRGAHNTLSCIVENMKKEGFVGGRVRIHHAESSGQAATLKEKILEKFPKAIVDISKTRGLCSFYAELGGLLVGFET